MSSPKPSSPKRARRAGPATEDREVAASARKTGSEPPALAAVPLATRLPFSPRIAHGWAVIMLGSIALVAFLNSLGNGFVQDDKAIIVENPFVQDLANLKTIFMIPYWPKYSGDLLYRPVAVASYALNYAVSGLRPFSYHLVNVLLHAGNSMLVYGVAWQLFRQQGLAVLAAAAFALHPIHTEAVANVVGRAELLAAGFVLVTWLLYLQREPASTPGSSEGWGPVARSLLLLGSVLSFALALLSKEHAIVLLGLLVLSDVFRATQRLPTCSLAILGRRLWRRLVTTYPPYLVVAAAYLLVRVAVLGTLTSEQLSWIANPLAGADTPTRLLTALRVLGRYLWLLVAPVRLSADYSYNQVPFATSVFEPDVLLPLLGAGAVAWLLGRRAPAVALGFLVFLLALAPVLNVFFPIGTIMAERLLYLPSFGFCVAIAGVVVLAAERLDTIHPSPWLASLPVGAFILLLVFYGGKTVARNQVWATDLGLWRATVATSPNSARAHLNLGSELMDLGDLEGARQAIQAALRIFPNWWDAQNKLGAVLAMQGRLDEAIAAHQGAIRLDPRAPEPYYNLGRAYEMKGLLSEARREFQQAAMRAPSRGSPYLYLGIGVFSFRQGELAEAERWFQRAIEVWPDYLDAHLSLGAVYLKQGRLAKAETEFKRALQIDPNSAKAHQGLGLVLRARGER